MLRKDRVFILWTGADASASTMKADNFVKVKDDLRYAKYFRMVKMGVPPAAVKVRHRETAFSLSARFRIIVFVFRARCPWRVQVHRFLISTQIHQHWREQLLLCRLILMNQIEHLLSYRVYLAV